MVGVTVDKSIAYAQIRRPTASTSIISRKQAYVIILQFFTPVKMVIFRGKVVIFFPNLLKVKIVGTR